MKTVNQTILIAVVLLVMVWLRFAGCEWGLPHLYHTDEKFTIKCARTMLESGDLNPHWFRYPSLLIYLQAILFREPLMRGLLNLPVAHYPVIERHWYYFLARCLTACFAVATALLLWRIALPILGSSGGIAATAFLTVSYLHNRNAHYATTDIPLAFFTVLSWWAAMHALKDTGRERWLLAGGIFAGLAAGMKYNGMLVLFYPLAAWLIRPGRRHLFTPGIVILAALLSFLATTPYALLDNDAFRADLRYEAEHYSRGHIDFEGDHNWLHYLHYLWVDLTGPAAVAALIGLAPLIRKHRQQAFVILLFPAAYFVFLSLLRVNFVRNLLPLIPCQALLAAAGLHALKDLLLKQNRLNCRLTSALTCMLLPALLAWPAVRVTGFTRNLQKPMTFSLAARWLRLITAEQPAPIRICELTYDRLPLPKDRFEFVYLGRSPITRYDREGVKLLVVSEWFAQERRKYPEWEKFFAGIPEHWQILTEVTGRYRRFWLPTPIHRIAANAGPTLVIFRRAEQPPNAGSGD